jgi:hypothetical protein
LRILCQAIFRRAARISLSLSAETNIVTCEPINSMTRDSFRAFTFRAFQDASEDRIGDRREDALDSFTNPSLNYRWDPTGK